MCQQRSIVNRIKFWGKKCDTALETGKILIDYKYLKSGSNRKHKKLTVFDV